ncbi:TetR/AcrR family transcriptional regulator [Arthrobacter tecti]
METRKPRGPYAKGAERREQIIKTATDVFASEGFDGAAMKRVAELVGVREATLFHYFSSKQELLTAVLAERDERVSELAGSGGLGLDMLPAVAKRNEQQAGLTTLYAVASATANDPEHDSHEYFRNRYEELVGTLAEEITELQKAGRVRLDLPAREAARLVIAVFDGVQLQWLYNKSVDMPEHLRLITNLLRP